jgi:hypothetical protein
MGLKKILIISYFFEPCNLTASHRVNGWVKDLNKFGYYPIVVTRNWDIHISETEDVLKSSGDSVIHKKHSNYEVYYLPYKSTLRDKIYIKFKNNSLVQKVSKIFTFCNLIFENYLIQAVPFSNLYFFSKKYLLNNSDVKGVVISGNPFVQFYFGYLLSKKLNVKWIADYRDSWNTRELSSNKSGLMKFISKIQVRSEKKWVSSAEFITSVSENYVDTISKFVNVPGQVISNGFDEIQISEEVNYDNSVFTILYSGTLYGNQDIETFIQVIISIINQNNLKIILKIKFIGLAFDRIQYKRVKDLIQGYEQYFEITSRISRKEVLKAQKQSDLLLMLSYGDLKGIPSSKLYEYISFRKNILLFPNDHDIIEKILNHTGLGVICSNSEELKIKLTNLIKEKQNNTISKIVIDEELFYSYSREFQTKKLAKLFDSILK